MAPHGIEEAPNHLKGVSKLAGSRFAENLDGCDKVYVSSSKFHPDGVRSQRELRVSTRVTASLS